jgi:hypothetical protein
MTLSTLTLATHVVQVQALVRDTEAREIDLVNLSHYLILKMTIMITTLIITHQTWARQWK